MENAHLKNAEDLMDNDQYNSVMMIYKRRKNEIENKIQEYKKDEKDFKETTNFDLTFFKDLKSFYQNANAHTKKKIVSSILGNNIQISETSLRTQNVNKIAGVIFNCDNELEIKKTGTLKIIHQDSRKVTPTRFELVLTP